MQEISRSSLGELKSVFKSNEDNVYYYKLLQRLNNSIRNFEFAQPIVQENAGFIIWRSVYNGPFNKYSELNDDGLKNEINIKVQTALKSLETNLKNFKEIDDFFNKVTEIPRENSIFYTYINNEIVIILTEWGFFLDEFRKGQGMLKKVFPSSLQSFIINFKTITGERVPNVKVELKLENKVINDNSNTNGIIKLNNVPKDANLIIRSLNNDFNDVEARINETNELDIIINKKVNLHFKVEDKVGKPVSDEEFLFVSDELGSLSFISNERGVFSLEHSTAIGHFRVIHKGDNLLLEEKIPTEDTNFKISLDLQNDFKPNIIEEFESEIQTETTILSKDVIIELLDNKNNPLKNHSVDFYGVSGKTKYATDSNGQFIVKGLEEGNDYAVFLDYKKTSWKKDFSHKFNTDKYTFNVKGKKILWWWLPLVLFALFFFLIPIPINHTYKAVDDATKQPIQGVLIQDNIQGAYTSLSSNLTDSNGKLKLHYGNETLFNQLIKNFNTNIIAQKSDYNLLTANVSLGFFRRWRSNLHLDKDHFAETIAPIYPIEEYLPCNGGEGYNSDGNQSYRFDLGKPNVEFLFEYYNDTKLDIISVLCEDGSLLFRVDKTTDTGYFSHSKKILSPCQYIEVSVEGNTNWGIKVHCP